MKRLMAGICTLGLLITSFGLGGGTMSVVRAEEGGCPVVIDGDGFDWNYVEPLFMGGGVITKLSAFTYEGTLYGKMELSNSGQFDTWHIYFDTDNDNSNHLYFNGADYLLETEILYEYQGDTGEWDGLVGSSTPVATALSGDKKILEFSIPVEGMGNATDIGINAATVCNWVDVAECPNAPNEYMKVPALEDCLKDTIVGLTENEISAFEASKEFSGTPTQWEAIQYDAVFKNSNLRALKAVTDGEFLYVGLDAKLLSNNFTLYIGGYGDDKMSGNGTDMSEIWPGAKDFGYQLKSNGTLYKMKGKSKMDTGTLITDFYKCDYGFEVKIPVENLGGIKNFTVAIEDNGEFLPDRDSEPLAVTCPILTAAPKITVDGDASDWAGIEPLGNGEGSLGDIYALRDNENLYVMTYISGITDPESSAAYTTSLFIGTDMDDSTGFQHSGYAKHNSGDFLFQDWNSYGPDMNQEFFYAADPVILEWNMKKQYVEGYKKVYAPTEDPTVYCAEYIVPIATMKETTETIGDDLYVAIDRNDCQTDEETYERKTPEGWTPARDPENGSFVKVPKYQTESPIDLTDFDLGDWVAVANKAKHQGQNNLCAVVSSDRLYTMLTADGGLSTNVKYYITCNGSGFKYDGHEDVSYVVIRGRLYQVTGDNKIAEDSKAVYQYYEDSYILMQLYREYIGNPSSIKLAASVNDDALVLPENGSLTVSTEVEINRDEDLFFPEEDFEFYDNPYKGWVGWADTYEGDVDSIAVDHKLIYVDIKWSELEPEKGEYAFEAIEKQYQFEKWLSEGCRMVLRFVMDNPNLDATRNPDIKRMDIPQWLLEELAEENAEGEGAGVFYNGETILGLLGGVGFSPNYKSPKLLEYHDKAVAAMAERYDDPNITAYVEVGSLGHWAEFHTWPTGTGEFPDPELAQRFMQTYQDNFHNVKIGIRKPYALAAENNWGLYNDIFGVTSDGGTPTFLEWAATGNTDMPGSTPEDIAASAMPDWWKLNFSGGEFANGDFRTNALDENIAAVLGQIRDSHTTWLGPCSGCDLKTDSADNDLYLYNAYVMVNTMGYRYGVYSITQKDYVAPGSENAINISIKNSGVAPIYYDCPCELLLVDANGQVALTQELDVDTREWLPGRSTINATLSIPSDLAKGEYTLAFVMKTADDSATPIYLANTNRAEDGSYALYQMTVTDDESLLNPAQDAEEEPAKGDEAPVETSAKGGLTNLQVWVIAGIVILAFAALMTVYFRRKYKNKEDK